MNKWQVQEAKARFSELLDKTKSEGPQVITRYGEDTAVVITKEQFDLYNRRKPSLIEVLLDGPIIDDLDELIGPRTDTGREVDLSR